MMRVCAFVLNCGVVGALMGVLAFGCSLHPQGSVPGCRVDHPSDCEEGWQCRSGVCVFVPTDGGKQDAGTDVLEGGGEEAAVESGVDVAVDMGVDTDGDADEEVDEDASDALEAGSGDESEGGNEDAGE